MLSTKEKTRACPPTWRKFSTLKGLAKVTKKHRTLHQKYREGKYQCIQEICLIEVELRKDNEAIKKFCSNAYWRNKDSRPKPDQPEKLLHYLFIYLCKDRNDNNKTASLYKRAAQNLLVSNLPRDRLAEELEARGGIRACAAAKAKPQKHAASDIVYRAENRTAEDIKLETQPVAVSAARASAETVTRAVGISKPNILEIELKDDELEEILAVEEGGTAELTVKNLGLGSNGWIRFGIIGCDLW